jgi:hypothetical protein
MANIDKFETANFKPDTDIKPKVEVKMITVSLEDVLAQRAKQAALLDAVGTPNEIIEKRGGQNE